MSLLQQSRLLSKKAVSSKSDGEKSTNSLSSRNSWQQPTSTMKVKSPKKLDANPRGSLTSCCRCTSTKFENRALVAKIKSLRLSLTRLTNLLANKDHWFMSGINDAKVEIRALRDANQRLTADRDALRRRIVTVEQRANILEANTSE